MNKYMAEKAAKFTAAAATLAAFLERYGDQLPDGIGYVSISHEAIPECNLGTGNTPDDRNRSLALVGDVFGRDGWEGEMRYNRDGYNWTRTILGVLVTIQNAEMMPPPVPKMPVPPHKFPLQLADAQ